MKRRLQHLPPCLGARRARPVSRRRDDGLQKSGSGTMADIAQQPAGQARSGWVSWNRPDLPVSWVRGVSDG